MTDIEQLLIACLDRDPGEWGDAVERACAEHPTVADELRRRFGIVSGFGVDVASEASVPKRLGEFVIVEHLGSGGMGVVYRAVQQGLGREVALKLIRPNHVGIEHARRRFEREAAAVASLQHPSVVSIHTVGEDNGVPYFAMELLRGKTLAQIIAGFAGRAPETLDGAALRSAVGGGDGGLFAGRWVEACVEIALQVAKALAHAHDQGFVHRDIKPSNIMLTRDGRAVILDFGLTGLLDGGDETLTRTGSPLGTTAYMAPEQVRGERQVGAAADIYSLGVMLYELLVLQPPFGGDNAASTQLAILETTPRPVRARNPAVGDDVQTVCQKAMERDIGDRYSTALALAADLERIQQRRPIHARPPGPVRRLVRLTQRRPALMTAGVSLLLAATVGPSVLWFQSRAHNEELRVLIQSERLAKEDLASALARERQARGEAKGNSEELRDVVEFLSGVFTESAPGSNRGLPLSGQQLVERAARDLDASLADRPGSRARIELTMANVFAGVGAYERGLQHVRYAVDHYARAPVHKRHLLAESHRVHGLLLALAGESDGLEELERALRVAESAYAPDDPFLIRYFTELAMVRVVRGDFEQARQVTDRLTKAFEAKLEQPAVASAFGEFHAAVGNSYNGHERLDDAERHLQQSIELLVRDDRLVHVSGGRALQDLAYIRTKQRRLEEAAELFDRAFTVLNASVGAEDHRTLGAECEWVHFKLAHRGASPLAVLPTLAEISRKLRERIGVNRPMTVRAHAYEMRALLRARRFAEALALCERHDVVEHARSIVSASRRLLLSILTNRSICHSKLGQHRDALAAIGAALDVRREIDPPRSPRLLRFLLGHAASAVKVREFDIARASLEEVLTRTADHCVWIKPPNPRARPKEAGVAALESLLQIERLAARKDAIAAVESRLVVRREKAAAVGESR